MEVAAASDRANAVVAELERVTMLLEQRDEELVALSGALEQAQVGRE